GVEPVERRLALGVHGARVDELLLAVLVADVQARLLLRPLALHVEDPIPREAEPPQARNLREVVQAPLDRGAIHPRRTEVGLGLLVLLGDPGIGTLVRLEVAEGIGDPVTVDRLHLGAPQHGCEQGERHGQTHLLHRRLLGFAVEAAGARGSGSAASRTWATRASRWPPSRRRGGAAPKWRAR